MCTKTEDISCKISDIDSQMSSHCDSDGTMTDSEQGGLKKKYTCSYDGCSKTFANSYNLRRHVASSHCQLKRYSCDQCGKKFALPQYLKEHYYIHTGEKPYVCPFPSCGMRFRKTGKRALHKRIHYSDPNFAKADKMAKRRSLAEQAENAVQVTKMGQKVDEGYILRDMVERVSFPSFVLSKNLPCPSRLRACMPVAATTTRFYTLGNPATTVTAAPAGLAGFQYM